MNRENELEWIASTRELTHEEMQEYIGIQENKELPYHFVASLNVYVLCPVCFKAKDLFSYSSAIKCSKCGTHYKLKLKRIEEGKAGDYAFALFPNGPMYFILVAGPHGLYAIDLGTGDAYILSAFKAIPNAFVINKGY